MHILSVPFHSFRSVVFQKGSLVIGRLFTAEYPSLYYSSELKKNCCFCYNLRVDIAIYGPEDNNHNYSLENDG